MNKLGLPNLCPAKICSLIISLLEYFKERNFHENLISQIGERKGITQEIIYVILGISQYHEV